LKSDFLPIIQCPTCTSSLELHAETTSGAEVVVGALVCATGHSFPIVGGVPRFVNSEQYAGNFGFEWNIHRQTQLDTDTEHESEEAFRLKTGFTPTDLAGKLVLDVGCGMGRFSEVASRWGATVVGIDLSRAVDAAFENIGARENVHIAQADIFDLPFLGPTFDYIFSIGVLHHTPSTKNAFDQLPKLLKPRGRIAIWVYSSYSPVAYRASDVWRKATTRMPKRLLYALAHVSVPFHHARRIPGLRYMPEVLFPISAHPKPKWRVLDTFDWYSPRYQWKHTNEEVSSWFEAQGLVNVHVLSAPISIQGQRPADGDHTPLQAGRHAGGAPR
jgi:SAM-dependent methyltransferase